MKGIIKIQVSGNEIKGLDIELEVDNVEQLEQILKAMGLLWKRE